VHPAKKNTEGAIHVSDEEEDLVERQEGLAQFMKYYKTLRADFDYKKELADYREERVMKGYKDLLIFSPSILTEGEAQDDTL
jgi:hypothetical protein